MKNIVKNILLLFFSIFVCFIILEIALRFYNPLASRVKGNKIILPVYHRYVIKNKKTNKLDNPIVYTKNSLGFRGEEPPDNLDEYLSILTVGGSTTECLYLSDNGTWSYLLEQKLKKTFRPLWLNNAGLDGHSTHGHIVLLEDYLIKLRPKIVLFLIGINDVSMEEAPYLKNERELREVLAENFEVASLILNIYRVAKAESKQLTHKVINLQETSTVAFSEEEIRKELAKIEKDYIESYEKRLLKIIDICRKSKIDPVFITQPFLLGDSFDKSTGIYLGNIKFRQYNGKLFWKIIELYNRTTKKTAKENNIFVIDLASKFPKDFEYFYDYSHYSNKGAEKASEILALGLEKYLKDNYRDFLVE